MLADIRTFTDE